MRKEKVNIAASVRSRLYNLAKSQGVDFNRILLLYVQERILYRISLSRYHDNFILKGGLLFYGTHGQMARPTKDMDFWIKHKSNQPENILPLCTEIFSIQAPDGLVFDLERLSLEPIKSEEEYEGLRLKIPVRLEQARQIVQIDMGFSDVVIPAPVSFSYPILLTETEFEIMGYSWESVIAEKFEAMVKLGDVNSRMKDIYDIHFLLSHNSFMHNELQTAISQTFNHRKTLINQEAMAVVDAFRNNPSKKVQWQAFLRKSSLKIDESFEQVLSEVGSFLHPIIEAIIHGAESPTAWNPSLKRWERS